MIGGKARVLNFKIDQRKAGVFMISSPVTFVPAMQINRLKLAKKVCGLGAAWLSHPDRRSYEGVLFYPAKPTKITSILSGDFL